MPKKKKVVEPFNTEVNATTNSSNPEVIVQVKVEPFLKLSVNLGRDDLNNVVETLVKAINELAEKKADK
jgi:hypothetical protein